MKNFPNFLDVCDAAEILKHIRVPTAVMSNPWINDLLGTEVYFKCENQQTVGAFKFRGAYNAISRLEKAKQKAGVIAYSSGNHAQAVARVCQMLDIPATIVMPKDAPLIKRRATEAYGARVVEYDPKTESREQVAERINPDNKMSLFPPFNHPLIIAGQGTAALELIQAVPSLQQVLVPCGGGGLLSGTALAIKGCQPECRVIGVEPEIADDANQSFRQGKIISIDYPNTIADGTRTLSLGDLTFPIIMDKVDEMTTVTEAMIKEAVRVLFYHLKQVVEPSGALGLAALLSGAVKAEGPVGVILSGGNIDGDTMSAILNERSILKS